ncbi:MAG: DEAD/DEAH box helicase, partial [Limnobacter sp.]|nr:DEAD/DEAH box helicase [Limnobacter sp.]
MVQYRGLPPGPNVGTQLKALKRRKKQQENAQAKAARAEATAVDDASPPSPDQTLQALSRSKLLHWFKSKGWSPFEFQLDTWQAMQANRSGLLHATTGSGKTLAVWGGALLSCAQAKRPRGAATEVMWITPMRALAVDTTKSLQATLSDWAADKEVLCQTGDTDAATRTRIKNRPPFGLVTTPESLTLMLTRTQSLAQLNKLKVLVVDEWHELLGNKRGVQVQLAIARLVTMNPEVQIWGLSATLGNLESAMQALLHPVLANSKQEGLSCPEPLLVQGKLTKDLVIDSLIPTQFVRFPW